MASVARPSNSRRNSAVVIARTAYILIVARMDISMRVVSAVVFSGNSSQTPMTVKRLIQRPARMARWCMDNIPNAPMTSPCCAIAVKATLRAQRQTSMATTVMPFLSLEQNHQHKHHHHRNAVAIRKWSMDNALIELTSGHTTKTLWKDSNR